MRTLLYLGRLHPIKGLDLLLESWSRLPPQVRAGWRLRLAGPDGDGYRGVLEKQAAEARLADVDFVGPIYGEEKTAEYLRADLYILPSLTENFGMTIAEALAAGTPAIATRGAPWQGLETEKCGWWIERSEAGLTTALTEALQMPGAALHEMGARGRAWMMRDYDWDRLAAHMIAAYEWVCAGCPSPVPDCIRLD